MATMVRTTIHAQELRPGDIWIQGSSRMRVTDVLRYLGKNSMDVTLRDDADDTAEATLSAVNRDTLCRVERLR